MSANQNNLSTEHQSSPGSMSGCAPGTLTKAAQPLQASHRLQESRPTSPLPCTERSRLTGTNQTKNDFQRTPSYEEPPSPAQPEEQSRSASTSSHCHWRAPKVPFETAHLPQPEAKSTKHRHLTWLCQRPIPSRETLPPQSIKRAPHTPSHLVQSNPTQLKSNRLILDRVIPSHHIALNLPREGTGPPPKLHRRRTNTSRAEPS